ncbi:hypothetical protein LTR36_004017 [Oleoguttula mirabilis]|uniref:Arylamine N-acetyltransferase n=1 Tax=Oleoguttula mirabilis TaxID=1507867 RepID=A0AAV9JJT2_9PEZI|nr:hypothetical protein LTR36_004017 [Oleoguttula mirabilis]
MANRPRYTLEQLEQYFDRICLPQAKRIFDVSTLANDDQKLRFLNLLQKHQLCKVPWENLTQHYSWHRTVNVQPQHLFTKIVRNAGRGGYCMEANHFFHTVLLSLGFDVYMAGARIHRAGGEYGGWTHVVNLVRIAGVRYLLDGGFGPQGPARPVPLEHGVVSTQVAPAQCRVVFEALKQNLDQTQRVWVYEYRIDRTEGREWTAMYCFTDLEFTPADVESMNFAPWLNKKSFFSHRVVAVRFTTSKEVSREDANDAGARNHGVGYPDEQAMEGEIDGSVSINQDVLKWRRNGEVVFEWKFASEDERVRALEMYFGITLSEQDREAIQGTTTAIAAANIGLSF